MLRHLTAGAIMATVLASCTGLPAMAAPDRVETGQVRTHWLNARCEGSVADQKCNLRFPAGVSDLKITYVVGGVPFAVETAHTYQPRKRGPVTAASQRLTPGSRIDCQARGTRAACTLTFRSQVDAFNVTLYSAGTMWGGVVFTEIAGDDA